MGSFRVMEENANHHHKTVASLDSALSGVVMASFKQKLPSVAPIAAATLDSLSSKNDAIGRISLARHL